MSELTVLLPVYNGMPYLKPAIDSILSQTFQDFELLIINDCSNDGSRELIASYTDPRIRQIENERNLGLAATLNKGLQACSTPLVARQDQDDLSHPRRLERQLIYLQEHPHVVLLGAQGKVIDEHGRSVGPITVSCDKLSIRWALLFNNSFIHPSVVFRRAPILDVGGYGDFRYCEDYDLWSRVSLAHEVANLPDCLLKHRSLLTSMTGAPERASGLLKENRIIIDRNLRVVFPDRSFSPREIDLVSSHRPGVPADSAGAFLRLFRSLLTDYEKLHPEAAESPDFRRTVAGQYGKLAGDVGHPALVMQILATGIRIDPSFFLSPAGIRSAARALGGRSAKQRAANFRRHLQSTRERPPSNC